MERTGFSNYNLRKKHALTADSANVQYVTNLACAPGLVRRDVAGGLVGDGGELQREVAVGLFTHILRLAAVNGAGPFGLLEIEDLNDTLHAQDGAPLLLQAVQLGQGRGLDRLVIRDSLVIARSRSLALAGRRLIVGARKTIHCILHAVAVVLLGFVSFQCDRALGSLVFQLLLGCGAPLLKLLVLCQRFLRSLDQPCVVVLESLTRLHFTRVLGAVHGLLQCFQRVACRLGGACHSFQLCLAGVLCIHVLLLSLPTCLVRCALGRKVLLEGRGAPLHLQATAVRHGVAGVGQRGLEALQGLFDRRLGIGQELLDLLHQGLGLGAGPALRGTQGRHQRVLEVEVAVGGDGHFQQVQ